MYRDFTIPYTNPYPDKDLEMKEIVNGTFAVALSLTLLNGQPLSSRYVEYTNDSYNNVVNHIAKGDTSVQTLTQNQDEVATTSQQIKQMCWLPVRIEAPQNDPKYIYYPPFVYSRFEKTEKMIAVLGTKHLYTNNENMCLSKGKEGIVVYNEDGEVFYVTIYGDVHKINLPKNAYLLSGSWGKDFAIYKDDDNNYYLLDLNTWSVRGVTTFLKDKKFLAMGNFAPYIIMKDGIYDTNFNKVGENKSGYVPVSTFMGKDSGNRNAGAVIDGIWYGFIGSNKACVRFHRKTKTLTLVKNAYGMFASKTKFGYAPMYRAYDDNSYFKNFKVLRYNYIKRGVFFVTRFPEKFKALKTKENIGCLTNECDFFVDDDKLYYTYDFNNWIQIDPASFNLDVSDYIYRIWGDFGNGIVGYMGKLTIGTDADGNQGVKFKGIEFYK